MGIARALRRSGVVVAIAGLGVLGFGGGGLHAATVGSDTLKILFPSGSVAGQITIPEGSGAGTEESALFLVTLSTSLVAAGTLSTQIATGAITHYVFLSEPAGEAPDAGGLPPVTILGANGQTVVVSDLIVSTFGNTTGAQFRIALISDNNPDLATYTAAAVATGQAWPIIEETGGLQDITTLIGAPQLPGDGAATVLVQSDVSPVPLPAAVWGGGVLLAGVMASSRRRFRRA